MVSAPTSPLVAVQLPPGDGWVAAVERLWNDGAAVLPLDAHAPAAVIAAALEALRPAAVVTAQGRHALPDARRVPGGTAVVVTTSGSTGAPKGVVLSHAALRASAQASLDRLGANADDRWLCCLPLHHVAGLQVLIRSRLLATPAVIHGRFDAAKVARERSVTMVSLVPTMLRRLLDDGADLRHLRRVVLGGAAPGPRLLADAAAAGIPVVTTYGMTETCGGCVYDGVALDCAAVQTGPDGHIRIRGPMLFSGYHGRPDLTADVMEGPWLRTQDLGRFENGRLEILGRADDVIVTGGHNVAATWIAGLLERHPAVREAAVVGLADDDWGERVVAFVAASGAPPTLAELRAFVAEHAPAYAAPRELVVVEELPRLSSGKVDRLKLLR